MQNGSAREAPLWTKAELAERLNVKPRYIDHLVHEGRVPVVRVGRLVRFRPAEIETWLAAHTQEARR